MEAETPPISNEDIHEIPIKAKIQEKLKDELFRIPTVPNETQSRKSIEGNDEDDDANSTIHDFNRSNVTVIDKNETEKLKLNLSLEIDTSKQTIIGDGSDSGVEVCGTNDNILLRAFSSNSGGYASSYGLEDCTPAQSCDSSLISCCSTYEDAYDALSRRNSTLIEDIKRNRGEGTSEGGSESSSVTGSCSSRPSKRLASSTKKKVNVNDTKSDKTETPSKIRSRSFAPKTPAKQPNQDRCKSKERSQKPPITPRPSSIKPNATPRPSKTMRSSSPVLPDSTKKDATRHRATSSTRSKTPVSTPTDDGRWPSTVHKNSQCQTTSRSLRASSVTTDVSSTKIRMNQLANEFSIKSTIEKYATLPRRRKEKSADSIKDLYTKPPSREPSVNRASNLRKQLTRDQPNGKSLPPYPRKKIGSKLYVRTKIYQESNVQTVLTGIDIEEALAGIGKNRGNPLDVETNEAEVQVDRGNEKVDQLEAQLKALTEKCNKLNSELKEEKDIKANAQEKLAIALVEKKALKDELDNNMQKIQMILGHENGSQQSDGNQDSFLVLENRFHKAGQVVIRQENEISELHSLCRTLQKDLEKGLSVQKCLLQQQQDLEVEGKELQDFMQAEKAMLTEALHEAENKIKSYQKTVKERDEEIERHKEECRILNRINEQRRQENLSFQARMGAAESHSRDLLLQQGAAVSGTALALSGLTSRIDVFVEQLIMSYNISDKDLEDVIFHNEAYSNSNSDDESQECSKKRSPSPKKGSSFVSAIISAIKNAAAQTPFANSRSMIEDNSDSTEMLDSETEPCLMMENVLEDVSVPDGHSVNMISSTNSLFKSGMLTRSESFHNLSHSYYSRQGSENRMDSSLCESMYESYSENMMSLSEICPAVTLVDQVIEADNLLTKLLKVLRIIQLENDSCISDLQDESTQLAEKLTKQRDINDSARKQLEEWDAYGAKLKSESKDVKQQLIGKTRELEEVRADLQNHKKQIESLNQDVCELSTACSKVEMKLRTQEEEALAALKEWQETGQTPSADVLSKLVAGKDEMPILKEKLTEKEKQLDELVQEFQASRQVMSENWIQAVNEARKQYEAIDTALETLHSIQSVVQQYPSLAKLQRDLEETSFQCATKMPFAAPDYNANAAMLQAFANLTSNQATAINSPA